MRRLSTDASIAPLVAQFVPLKIDIENDDWGKWASLHPAEGNGIPLVYVVRADGQQLYGKSGSPGDALPQFLASHIASAGRILTPTQLAQVQAVVADARRARESGDAGAAVRRLFSLKRIGPLGELGSYASAALEADQLVAELREEGQAALAAAQEQLSDDDKFAGVLALLAAQRAYGSLPALTKEFAAADRQMRKEAAFKELVAPAEALHRALTVAPSDKRATREALAKVVSRFPDTPAAQYARDKMLELGSEPSAGTARASAGEPASVRTWTDASGKFRVEAELIDATEEEVTLRRTSDGQILKIPLSRLGAADREFVQDAFRAK